MKKGKEITLIFQLNIFRQMKYCFDFSLNRRGRRGSRSADSEDDDDDDDRSDDDIRSDGMNLSCKSCFQNLLS